MAALTALHRRTRGRVAVDTAAAAAAPVEKELKGRGEKKNLANVNLSEFILVSTFFFLSFFVLGFSFFVATQNVFPSYTEW